jgi:hypothetical protein
MHSLKVVSIIIALAISSEVCAQKDTSAQDRGLELALSDQTAQLRYDAPTMLGGTDSRLAYAIFLSEERDVVGSAALLMESNFNFGALDIRFGPQGYAALLNEQNEDVFAIALGVEARLNVLPSRGIAIMGSAFYSPDILTFGSSDKLTDFMVRGEIQLNDRLAGFAGYRWFELDLLMREERTLQNEVFAGVRWQLH